MEVDLELDAEFTPDLDTYPLHPALFDVAGASARVKAQDIYYLPLTYRSLRVLAPLTSRVTCRVLVDQSEVSGETMSCDMDLLSPEGDLLVQSRGFSIKRINDIGALADEIAAMTAAETVTHGPRGQAGPTGPPSVLAELASGMTVDQAAEVVARLLREPALPATVSVTHVPVEHLCALGRSITPASLRDVVAELAQATTPTESHPRPSLEQEYVEPRDDDERAVAAIWTETLGVAPIGMDDDFFALGGHSLAAVQIGARLRSEVGIDLELKDLFDNPTVAGVARTIKERRAAPLDAGQPETIQRWADAADEVADLSDDEVEAQLLALLAEEESQ